LKHQKDEKRISFLNCRVMKLALTMNVSTGQIEKSSIVVKF